MLVISLGGSLIVPNKVDYKFLSKFKKLILKYSRRNKIVIVTGGGHTCRRYLKSLEGKKFNEEIYSLIGIATTKLNARVVAGFFGKTDEIPDSLADVKKALKKNNIVICGALGFRRNMTSDGNAAELAEYLKADLFLNLTNVKGLYTKDPKKHKDAKFIQKIGYKKFFDIVKKIKFKVGQHFVLDVVAAKIIYKEKIKTVILKGSDLKNLKNFLDGKNFNGTVIS